MSSIGSQTSSPSYPFWPYYGYFDLGPVAIPPLPALFGLTDRATGAVKYVVYNPANSNHLTLSDTLNVANGRGRVKVYPAFEGPIVGGGWLLGLRNGRLLLDNEFGNGDEGPGPWVATIGSNVTVYELGVLPQRTAYTLYHLVFQPVSTQ